MMTNPIVQTMIPQQRHTQKSFPNPREWTANDWSFDVNQAQELNWRPGTARQSDFNYFSNSEPHQKLQNGVFNPLTGQEPIYGHMNYILNPLAQEQTNAHESAYQKQKVTRVANNMNPFSAIMSAPPYRYPVGVWVNSYKGSMSNPRYN